jgi:hypothetical protein
MPRKKRQQIKINDSDALQGLLQEAYNDACANIIAAQSNINEMANAAEPQDVDDLTKIAKEKTSALKVKDSAIRLKLEIAKMAADIIKSKGNVEEAVSERTGGKPSLNDFKAIRKMMEENARGVNNDEDEIED